jgi:hypothetical protein
MDGRFTSNESRLSDWPRQCDTTRGIYGGHRLDTDAAQLEIHADPKVMKYSNISA